MKRSRFEEIVELGIKAIPQEFLDKLNNVAIVVENEPTIYQRRKAGLRHGFSLFGLYEGVSQLRRGGHYSGVLPDKITIFQNSILRVSRNEEDVKEIVKNTVWHEIAHHFGMSEEEVRAAEKRRRRS